MTSRDLPDDIAAELAVWTVTLHRDDAEDLADALRHAGALLTHLAGDPAIERAHHDLSEGTAGELATFALDLLIHAAELSDLTGPEDQP